MKMNKDQILGLVRHILTFVGGILVIKGIGNETLWMDLVGGAMGLASTIWSFVDKKTPTV